ncbi:MAG TPA: hypothetical protein VJ745_00110 [Gaiellaceae bacterium]|nr:hypothetical protein [Gaiellaceae bacterium]
MAKKPDKEYWAEYEAERRELEELFARMRERYRLADERDARRRERLRRLTFGVLGRHADTA